MRQKNNSLLNIHLYANKMFLMLLTYLCLMAHLTPVRLAKQLTLKTVMAPKPGQMEPATSENGVKAKPKARVPSTMPTAMFFKAVFNKTKPMVWGLIHINQASGMRAIGLTTCSMEKEKKFLKTALPTSVSLEGEKSRAKGLTRGLMGRSTMGIG